MAAALSLLALGACAAPVAGPVPGPAAPAPLRVTREGAPFANHEGAAARRQGVAICAAQGRRLVSTIYDRYEAGAWVFVEGCA